MNISNTEYEILNFIRDRDPEGTKGVSNMFIHGRLKHILDGKEIRKALRNLTLKNILEERNFHFFLKSDVFRRQIVEVRPEKAKTKITLTRIIYVIGEYYKKYNDYPLPRQVHRLFEEIYKTRVDPQTFTRTMRKFGEEERLDRIPVGNKFKYKTKGIGQWSDKPLNQFMGGGLT